MSYVHLQEEHMRGIHMSGVERLFFGMGFGGPTRTEFLIAALGPSRAQEMGEKIVRTFDDIQDEVIFRHRYGIGCEAKTIKDILPFVNLRTQSVVAIQKLTKKLTKKLRAQSRAQIVLDEIRDIEY